MNGHLISLTSEDDSRDINFCSNMIAIDNGRLNNSRSKWSNNQSCPIATTTALLVCISLSLTHDLEPRSIF